MEKTERHPLLYTFFLLLAAAIWGFAFAAQREGVQHIGPLMFNGIRFILGALALLPLALFRKAEPAFDFRKQLPGYLAAGFLCAAAAGLQQIGIVYTTAGKAGFITGLYVIFVPLLALLRRHVLVWNIWPAALLATAGLFMLSLTENFTFEGGDLLVLASSLLWAIHMLVIGRLVQTIDSIILSIAQFVICGILHLAGGLVLEPFDAGMVSGALLPIIYSGVFSIGVGYTIQVVVQKYMKPARVSIIICSEGIFAAVGGWLLLGENLSPRQLAGAGMMLAGMLIARISFGKKRRTIISAG